MYIMTRNQQPAIHISSAATKTSPSRLPAGYAGQWTFKNILRTFNFYTQISVCFRKVTIIILVLQLEILVSGGGFANVITNVTTDVTSCANSSFPPDNNDLIFYLFYMQTISHYYIAELFLFAFFFCQRGFKLYKSLQDFADGMFESCAEREKTILGCVLIRSIKRITKAHFRCCL